MTEEQRQQIVRYRVQRAFETLDEVDLLVKNQLYNGAINRLYYACFYAVSALFAFDNRDCSTHAGARQQFGLHYIRTGIIDQELGKFYSAIFNSRQTGDYDDLVHFDSKRIEEFIGPARTLIQRIEQLVKPAL